MVAGTSTDKHRLEIAERLGADAIVDVERQDPVTRARDVTGGGIDAGLDFVFEATGDPKSVQQALDMVRRGGKVILIGIHSGPAEFNPTPFVRGSKSIIGAYGYDKGTWQRALKLLSSGRTVVEEVITHRVPLTEAEEGFKLALSREASKVLLVP
jgi:threonine dehydrogenase-like Zn-dependent dehydrogenase